MIVLIIILTLYIIFLRECKKETPCLANDEIVVKKSVWDSIKAISNLKPIIRIDTVIIYKPYKVIQKVPENIAGTDNMVIDSCELKNSEIDVKLKTYATGPLLGYEWQYTPIIKIVEKTKEIFVPRIVDNVIEKEIPKNGFYIYGVTGGNESSFLFGGGFDYISKKNTEFGVIYQRFGNDNIYSIKVGIPLKFRF